MSETEIGAVLEVATELRFPRNSIPLTQGQPAEQFYLLIQGRARFFFFTQDGRKIILRWIVPGQIFGAAALLSAKSQYLVGTEMTQDSVVLAWNRSTIRTLGSRFPQLLDNLLNISQDYLHWYVSSHESLTTHDAQERLAHLLSRLCESIGTPVRGGISLDVTNEELACAANMTVFTVSRLLKQWQRLLLITKGRSKLVVRSQRLLSDLRAAHAGSQTQSIDSAQLVK